MTIIGSARIDERGKATGGKAGDQKQTTSPDYKGEVSMQNFYVSSKGWYILRAKNPSVASSIALSMTIACNNPNIGYNQARRLDIIKAGTHATAPTSCDCSSLVRQCVREAGIEVTINETKGTMHGFDIMQNAKTTKVAVKARIEFMKNALVNDKL